MEALQRAGRPHRDGPGSEGKSWGPRARTPLAQGRGWWELYIHRGSGSRARAARNRLVRRDNRPRDRGGSASSNLVCSSGESYANLISSPSTAAFNHAGVLIPPTSAFQCPSAVSLSARTPARHVVRDLPLPNSSESAVWPAYHHRRGSHRRDVRRRCRLPDPSRLDLAHRSAMRRSAVTWLNGPSLRGEMRLPRSVRDGSQVSHSDAMVRMPASEEFSVQLARTGSAPVNARGPGLMASTLHPSTPQACLLGSRRLYPRSSRRPPRIEVRRVSRSTGLSARVISGVGRRRGRRAVPPQPSAPLADRR